MFCGSAIQPPRFPLVLAEFLQRWSCGCRNASGQDRPAPPPAVPRMAWQRTQALFRNISWPRCLLGSEGCSGRLKLTVHPASNLIRWLRDHPERHVGMLQAAELGTLAAKFARTVRLDPFESDTARNEIALAVQVRDPEAVDDVVGIAADCNGLAHRNVDFVGGLAEYGSDRRSRSGRTTTTGSRSLRSSGFRAAQDADTILPTETLTMVSPNRMRTVIPVAMPTTVAEPGLRVGRG